MRNLTLLTLCWLGLTVSADAVLVAILDHETSHGSKGIIQSLREDDAYQVKVISEITSENLQNVAVLIISHQYNLDCSVVVREFVRSGGGVLLTHDAAGSGRPFGGSASYARAESTFPEISETSTPGSGYMVSSPRVKIIRKHPITEGLPDNGFNHIYWDHAILCPTDDRVVLMEDSESADEFVNNRFRGTQLRWNAYFGGNAVLIAAPFGKGRVVLSGMLLGMDRDHKAILQGAEKTLLFNAVVWLAGNSPLGVPERIETPQTSKYARWILQKTPAYQKEAVFIDTQTTSLETDSAGKHWVQFRLPETVLPRQSIPVVMDLPEEWAPRTVAVVQLDGTIAESVPVQVEMREDGKSQLVFIESFPNRDVTAVFDSEENSNSKGLKVTLNTEGTLAEITGPHFSILVGVEGGEPTLQCVRVFDWDWHHTWDGLERNNLSAPILRLAESLWPFKATPPSIDHEVGLPFPEVNGDGAKTVNFPVRVTLRVGNGRLTVYRTGQTHLEKFYRSGRIATFLVDRYISDTKDIPETVSYDLPAVREPWLWALRDHRYALGGNFHVLDKMGETGLAPGMERMLSLSGDTLVFTTDVKDLQRYQLPAVPCIVTATSLPVDQRAVRTKSETPLTYPTIKVSQRRLWKMRGTDDFFEILAQPVEIYSDLVAKTPSVAQWQIQGDDNVQIGASMAGPFGNTVDDPMVIEQIKRADPRNEDAAVWRRLYLRCQEITDKRTTQLRLIGTDTEGEPIIVVAIEIHQAISLPTGIFTYGPMWVDYWVRKVHGGRCPPDQWPKLFRDIAVSGLDYIIHTTHSTEEHSGENPVEIQSRLERYGMWWMCSLMQAYHGVNSIRNLNKEGEEHIERFYSEHIPRWKGVPNIIAWYLSDEIPEGECENGVLNESYQTVSLFYDLCRKYDDKNRPGVNLITPWGTSVETATKYLKTDLFSWDPYGLGAAGAYEAAAKVDAVWRKTTNKPAWITLRSCGPTFYDCLDLWLDIRRRSAASFRGNVDGLNYFMYSHWGSDMETHAWYAVIPGAKGPIATERWQALNQIVGDIELLTTAEYLVDRYGGPEKNRLAQNLEMAKLAGQEGKFYEMRTILDTIIRTASQED